MGKDAIIQFEFPFLPPSVNKAYYTDWASKTRHKSRDYREFIANMEAWIPKDLPDFSEGLLIVEYNFYFPDKRIRDAANYEKCLSDTLVKYGVMKDDSQIKRYIIEKEYDKGKPATVLRITKI